jgi:hypothetical protein
MTSNSAQSDPSQPNPANPPKPSPGIGEEQHTTWHPQPSKVSLGTPQCTAKSKRSQERCRCYAMPGCNVCSAHGGMVPAVRAKAARRLDQAKVEAEVEVMLASESVAVIDNPWEAFSQLAAKIRAQEKIYSDRVDALNGQISYSAAGAGTEQIKGEVSVWLGFVDRSVKALDLMIRHDVEGKRLALDVARTAMYGEYLGRALDGILDGLELTDHQRALIPVVLPPAIRALGEAKPLPNTFRDGLMRDKIL